jgi:hypothetical protein
MKLKIFAVGSDLAEDFSINRPDQPIQPYALLIGSADDIRKVAAMWGSDVELIEYKEPKK